MECVTKTITKAGVHAEVIDEDGNVPVTVFIARDHHFTNKEFSDIKEGRRVVVSIIGSKYELNDKYIYTIANLTRSKL